MCIANTLFGSTSIHSHRSFDRVNETLHHSGRGIAFGIYAERHSLHARDRDFLQPDIRQSLVIKDGNAESRYGAVGRARNAA